MAFRQSHGLGQFLNRSELTSFHAPLPAPCPADSALRGAEIGTSQC